MIEIRVIHQVELSENSVALLTKFLGALASGGKSDEGARAKGISIGDVRVPPARQSLQREPRHAQASSEVVWTAEREALLLTLKANDRLSWNERMDALNELQGVRIASVNACKAKWYTLAAKNKPGPLAPDGGRQFPARVSSGDPSAPYLPQPESNGKIYATFDAIKRWAKHYNVPFDGDMLQVSKFREKMGMPPLVLLT